MKRITATEAARRFSDIVNRVRYQHESFLVERNGEPMCQIVPTPLRTAKAADLIGVLPTLPRPDEEYFRTVRDLTRKQPRAEKSRWPR
ncbi:MAG TPA: hypothetical protein VEJ86_12095 [Candidatus Binataceae bacterium]|nr:hypothetical protein [Candidatus Binataceae bacterium]